MAALPSPTQVAGYHNAIYEAYYHVVDPKGLGSVGGMEAARFLKRSGLSDVILSKIWDLSDPGGRGALDKAGVFVALKLVALVQNGKDLSISNINNDVAPPKMGDIPIPKPVKPPPPINKSTPLITSLPPTAVDWSVKSSERDKYDSLFDSLQPQNGLIPGNKVKNVLMESKLPLDTLGKIWDLADQDKDGMLDRHEFITAMHLVYKALDKFAIPNSLPVELMAPAKRKTSTPMAPPILSRGLDGVKPEVPKPPAISQPQSLISGAQPIKPVQSVKPSLSWVVTSEEKRKSDSMFIKSDIDKDGFVSGQEIKDVFLQSGVPQAILAHIWALCDIKQNGKLNNEQFALAMWFVARCVKGDDPPPALTPEMVPPSFRSTKPTDGLVENNNTKYSNPELDMISKDIDELIREKLGLEHEIAQKEGDLRIKNGEIRNLQSELDTLAATLKQLENQKGEAQKRLNDLKAQVDKLRVQATEQAETVSVQEAELASKKEQLEGLRNEEHRLEKELDEGHKTLNRLTTSLQDLQLNISQVKASITQLEEQTRQLTDAVRSCDNALSNEDAMQVPDTALRINPDFREVDFKRLGMVNGTNKQNGFNDSPNIVDPFASKNVTAGFGNDPFKNDPFKNSSNAFASNDSFSSAFSKENDGFSSDPFGGGSFDAFGDSKKTNINTGTDSDKDAFGCDPFAILHAPTRDGSSAPARPTSPSPALPPKKSKQPPPRPAPPRPNLPPGPKKVNDPFGEDSFASSGGFADFSDFEQKFSNNFANKNITKNSRTAKPIKKQPEVKGLEFTDDPFRDYRYEDPFDIAFDDEDEPSSESGPTLGASITTKSGSVDTLRVPQSNNNNNNGWSSSLSNINIKSIGSGSNDNNNSLTVRNKFDPFGLDGRQSVPLPRLDDNFGSVGGRASVPLRSNALSEDEQLAWATTESLRLEKERQKEQADLEYALNLSRANTKKL